MKKLLSILLTAVITISSLPVSVFAATFNDVSSEHWAYDYIEEMADRNVLSGYPNGSFCPENNVSRAEFSKILVTTILDYTGLSLKNLQDDEIDIPFSDMKETDWFSPYVAYVYENNFLEGYSDNSFKPNQSATREDVATALSKLFAYSTLEFDGGISLVLTYGEEITEKDMDIISSILCSRLTSSGVHNITTYTDIANKQITLEIPYKDENYLPVLLTKGEFKITDADNNTVLSEECIKDASYQYGKLSANDNMMKYYVSVDLNDIGKQKFYDATKNATNNKDSNKNYLNIMLDDVILSSPKVHEAIQSDSFVIENNLSEEESQRIACCLKSGALPCNYKTEYHKIVEPNSKLLSNMFYDSNDISTYKQKYVYAAALKGIISGYNDGSFKGKESITRAEVATMIYRAIQYNNITATPEPMDNMANNTIYETSIPKPTKTPKPTATPKPTKTSEPEPTEEPERPYIVDTITKANILGGSWGMQEDNDGNFYYYDTNKNKVYQLDVNSEDVDEIFDVSDLELRFDDRFDYEVGEDEVYESNDPKNPDNIVEHYKDFEVSDFYYNKSNNKMVLKGTFKTLTDWYGLKGEDKSVEHEVYIDITNVDPVICEEDVLDGLVMPSKDLQTYSYEVIDGNNKYKFCNEVDTQSVDVRYDMITVKYIPDTSQLLKYNYNTREWESIRNGMKGTYVGLKNKVLYLWDANSGDIITCALNTKLNKLSLNTNEDVEVFDFKEMPTNGERQGSHYGVYNSVYNQIFINDNENIIFYDEDENAIRIIKER